MRHFLLFAAKAAITAALLYLAIGRTDFSVIAERLTSINLVWIAAALALSFLQLALLSIRWRHVAAQCEADLPLGHAFRFNLIAMFFNQVLPSTVGGDAARIWLFARDSAGWSKATYSVLLDRFIGMLALAILVTACLPWALQLIHSRVGQTALLVIGIGSIAAAACFIGTSFLRWNWLKRWALFRHVIQLATTARHILFSGRIIGFVMPLSLLIHVIAAAIAWCVAEAISAPFPFWLALLLLPPVMLIATVPISIAGWGVREKSLVLAFAYAGLSETDGFLISVLFGATMFVVGIIGGAVWLASRAPVAMHASPAPPNG